MSDPKPAKRIKASAEEWVELREAKLGPCRVCGTTAWPLGLHHLVSRGQGGDDLEDNLVPLCGSGTTGCHERVESRDPVACHELRKHLTEAEIAYVLEKRGEAYLDGRYPTGVPL